MAAHLCAGRKMMFVQVAHDLMHKLSAIVVTIITGRKALLEVVLTLVLTPNIFDIIRAMLYNIYNSHEQAVVCAFTCPLFLLWVSGSLTTRIGGVVPVWTLVLPLDALLAVAVALTTHK
jgi:hypothetical protein